MKLSTFFIIITSITVAFVLYEIMAFQHIRQADHHFEINTRFNQGDIIQWLAPIRILPLVSRWHENLTSNSVTRTVNALALKDCLLAENPCVDMLDALAPKVPFWKTADDLQRDKAAAAKELSRQLARGKIISKEGSVIKTALAFTQELRDELNVLESYQDGLASYSRSCGLYNIVHYTALYLFSALHYSQFVSTLPNWIKKILNHVISRYVQTHYETLKTETTKIAHKQSPWYYRWRIGSLIEDTFDRIKSRAEKHTYIHDYSPYYQKLRYSFDLEVKNVCTELQRLIDRNKALQELAGFIYNK